MEFVPEMMDFVTKHDGFNRGAWEAVHRRRAGDLRLGQEWGLLVSAQAILTTTDQTSVTVSEVAVQRVIVFQCLCVTNKKWILPGSALIDCGLFPGGSTRMLGRSRSTRRLGAGRRVCRLRRLC